MAITSRIRVDGNVSHSQLVAPDAEDLTYLSLSWGHDKENLTQPLGNGLKRAKELPAWEEAMAGLRSWRSVQCGMKQTGMSEILGRAPSGSERWNRGLTTRQRHTQRLSVETP